MADIEVQNAKMEPNETSETSVSAGKPEDFPVDFDEEMEPEESIENWRSRVFFQVVKVLALIGVAAYTVAAVVIDLERAAPVLYVEAAFLFMYLINEAHGRNAEKWDSMSNSVQNTISNVASNRSSMIAVALLVGAIVVGVTSALITDSANLTSVLGVFGFILMAYLLSKKRTQVKWRPVINGFLLQWIFGVLILRTDPGFNTFKFLGDQTTILLGYSSAGANFVYGFAATGFSVVTEVDGGVASPIVIPGTEFANGVLSTTAFSVEDVTGSIDNDEFDFVEANATISSTATVNDTVTFSSSANPGLQGRFVFGAFAFFVLPTVIFFSSLVSVLFYLGWLQAAIRVIGRFMAFILGTSASESLSAAGNIFVGQTEAPLLVRPFLKDMTESELHAIMTGGFATIAGGVLAAYISFGVSPTHLLGASVMSAPAALAISKLIMPETEESKTAAGSGSYEIETPKESNVIEAASNGAAVAVTLTLNIAGQLIAFLAIVAMFNGWIGYFGGLIDIEDLSFEKIASYFFYPLAFIMGVEADNCFDVATLIGVKIFVNEFAAYDQMVGMINQGLLTERSEVIATYALCGFSNLSSIGIQLGGLGPLAPNQIKKLSKHVFSAMIAGNIACFLTASIAGVLYKAEKEIA